MNKLRDSQAMKTNFDSTKSFETAFGIWGKSYMSLPWVAIDLHYEWLIGQVIVPLSWWLRSHAPMISTG